MLTRQQSFWISGKLSRSLRLEEDIEASRVLGQTNAWSHSNAYNRTEGATRLAKPADSKHGRIAGAYRRLMLLRQRLCGFVVLCCRRHTRTPHLFFSDR